jgi:hypothetical protein
MRYFRPWNNGNQYLTLSARFANPYPRGSRNGEENARMGWLTWSLATNPEFRDRRVIPGERVFSTVGLEVVHRTRRVIRVVFHGRYKRATLNFHVSPAINQGMLTSDRGHDRRIARRWSSGP